MCPAVDHVHHRNRQDVGVAAALADPAEERGAGGRRPRAFAVASETPRIAFAPRRPLLAVPSSSTSRRVDCLLVGGIEAAHRARDLALDVRVTASIDYLVANLAKAPVFCHALHCAHALRAADRIAARHVRLDHAGGLELHARGAVLAVSGTCWTIFHLYYEEEAAHLLGIPYAEVMQVALLPVAYTQGSAFRPGPRKPLETLIHWETW